MEKWAVLNTFKECKRAIKFYDFISRLVTCLQCSQDADFIVHFGSFHCPPVVSNYFEAQTTFQG